MLELLNYVPIAAIITIAFLGWKLFKEREFKQIDLQKANRNNLYANIMTTLSKIDEYQREFALQMSPTKIRSKFEQVDKNLDLDQMSFENVNFKQLLLMCRNLVSPFVSDKKDINHDEVKLVLRQFNSINTLDLEKVIKSSNFITDFTSVVKNIKEAGIILEAINELLVHDQIVIKKLFGSTSSGLITTPRLKIDSSENVMESLNLVQYKFEEIIDLCNNDADNSEISKCYSSILDIKIIIEGFMLSEMKNS